MSDIQPNAEQPSVVVTSTRPQHLIMAATAAFFTYFCFYAFRRPFTAATFDGREVFGVALKTALVLAQLVGYMVAKFIGIKVISEMRPAYRAAAIVIVIAAAELALVGFAFVPIPLKVLMMFLNGVPLGMVFGLVLSFLEGRRQTEALAAVFCASFIVSAGVVKSVGQWLLQNWNVTEFTMPMVAGALFFPPLLVSVWMLQATPPPDEADKQLRSERTTMGPAERKKFVGEFWPGLTLLVLVYVAITVVRTVRDDFGVEIWRDMGVTKTPSIFARVETIVAIGVTVLNGMTIWIRRNVVALRVIIWLMAGAFALVMTAVWLYTIERISPFAFMVACGVGLYVPYVAFHTTVFERFIAAARRPCNLGFLMCLADAIGYLGYAVVIVIKTANQGPIEVLPFFLKACVFVSVISIAGLLATIVYFRRALSDHEP